MSFCALSNSFVCRTATSLHAVIIGATSAPGCDDSLRHATRGEPLQDLLIEISNVISSLLHQWTAITVAAVLRRRGRVQIS